MEVSKSIYQVNIKLHSINFFLKDREILSVLKNFQKIKLNHNLRELNILKKVSKKKFYAILSWVILGYFISIFGDSALGISKVFI